VHDVGLKVRSGYSKDSRQRLHQELSKLERRLGLPAPTEPAAGSEGGCEGGKQPTSLVVLLARALAVQEAQQQRRKQQQEAQQQRQREEQRRHEQRRHQQQQHYRISTQHIQQQQYRPAVPPMMVMMAPRVAPVVPVRLQQPLQLPVLVRQPLQQPVAMQHPMQHRMHHRMQPYPLPSRQYPPQQRGAQYSGGGGVGRRRWGIAMSLVVLEDGMRW